ncbi:hypothetical protein [Lysinibacillus xylanilyticus]|uniref:hypothetical protein n=1 Tax=Lysinibacillus xylanilyticus TaxID=582475 RepID=UPI003D09197A
MSRLGQHDVGHEGVITGCDALSLRPLSLIPKESPSLHSNQLIYSAYIKKMSSTTFGVEPKNYMLDHF